ncbi:hypothetical protein IV500_12085 [Paeniglutamicibacter antarcticus]|uniref:Uncharacterized protein n=1 Tax=Arthrobacter terrae TaxID=2935737 RepID=A0A931CRH9_9MICC|nr:hypothetical protein [Arthrobacter terrae]MBG0740119.1 hypothetical protein [Arthrobacter terrae]
MPSFRAILRISGLRPGNAPESVLATAVETLGSIHLVEANQLDVVRGVPQISLRFTVQAARYDDENRQACNAGASVRHAVESVAVTGPVTVTRRIRGKWVPISAVAGP